MSNLKYMLDVYDEKNDKTGYNLKNIKDDDIEEIFNLIFDATDNFKHIKIVFRAYDDLINTGRFYFDGVPLNHSRVWLIPNEKFMGTVERKPILLTRSSIRDLAKEVKDYCDDNYFLLEAHNKDNTIYKIEFNQCLGDYVSVANKAEQVRNFFIRMKDKITQATLTTENAKYTYNGVFREKNVFTSDDEEIEDIIVTKEFVLAVMNWFVCLKDDD